MKGDSNMKIGVLGTGFGAYHVELYSQIKEVETIYVFGRKSEKLEDLKSKFGIQIVTDIDEIMKNNYIDLVDLCLPNALHSKYAIQAIEHGKHVFCETPVAYSMADAIAMQNAKQKSGKQLMVNLFLRFEHAYETLSDIAQKGEYGKLHKIQIQRYTPPYWGDLGKSKIVTDLMIHDIDFVSYLLGMPSKIEATKTVGKEGQCAVSALCSYDNAFAEINSSSMMPNTYPFAVSYEVIYDHAVVRYYEDGYQDHRDTKLTVFTDDCRKDLPLLENNCYDKAIHYALDMIKTAEKPKNDISDALVSLEMALKIKDLIL